MTSAAAHRDLSRIFWSALQGHPVAPESWLALLQRARIEGVLPALAAVQPDMPGRADIRRAAGLDLLLKIELLRRTRTAMEKAGIPWVVLKGLALGCRLYEDPLDRASGDCDILVRPADRETAVCSLETAGFRATEHHRELFVGDAGEVDLHTHFLNRERVPSRGTVGIEEPEWWSRIEQLETPAGSIPVLAPEHLARYLALHLIHHHGCIGARWHLDLYRLLRSQPELADVIRASCGRGGSTLIAVQAALFGDSGTTAIPKQLADRIVALAARDGMDVPGLRFLLTLRELDTVGRRMRFLRESLWPDPTTLAAVAAPGGRRPLAHHLARMGRTLLSLTRLTAKALYSSS